MKSITTYSKRKLAKHTKEKTRFEMKSHNHLNQESKSTPRHYSQY